MKLRRMTKPARFSGRLDGGGCMLPWGRVEMGIGEGYRIGVLEYAGGIVKLMACCTGIQ